MSDARWCDYGDHAFKGGQPGITILGRTEQVHNQWGGQQPSTANLREICPECSARLGLNEDYEAPVSPSERHKALLAEVEKK